MSTELKCYALLSVDANTRLDRFLNVDMCVRVADNN